VVVVVVVEVELVVVAAVVVAALLASVDIEVVVTSLGEMLLFDSDFSFSVGGFEAGNNDEVGLKTVDVVVECKEVAETII
jgi:hypothetical protein